MEREKIPGFDRYKSIAAPSSGIYKDNGSRFLAFACPVESEEQAKERISRLKREYFDARHHCYAYRIGYDGAVWRANDDGEPSSTAGRPIYGQILSNELSDIIIVVVRYFGGIKLGVPGLIKAYKSSSADAIANASIIEKVAKKTFIVRFGYAQMNDMMQLLKQMQITAEKREFGLECNVEIKIPLSEASRFTKAIEKIEGTKLSDICQKV